MITRDSDVWRALEQKLQARIDVLHKDLESWRADHPKTQYLRGQVRAIRDVLELPDKV